MEILELKNGSVDINNIDTYNELKKKLDFLRARLNCVTHVLVRETRDEVIERINNLAKDLAQDDKTYKKYIIRKKNDHDLIIKGINDLIGDFVNIIEIKEG